MSNLIWSVFGFIVAISVLVCFHEYGHYWMARRLGVKVLRFSLGLGKPLKTLRSKDGVEWCIAPFPIGGYVKLLDEREGPLLPHERHLSFNVQSIPRKIAIFAAGPIFNFVLAVVLYWMMFVIGVPGWKPIIDTPLPHSAAESAGLQSGDEVLQVAGETIPTWSVLRSDLLDRVLDGGSLPLTIRKPDGTIEQKNLDLSRVSLEPKQLFDDLGLVPFEPDGPVSIAEVVPTGTAHSAGIEVGDKVLALDDKPVTTKSFQRIIASRPGEAVKLTIERDGKKIDKEVLVGTSKDDPSHGLVGVGLSLPSELWQDLRAVRKLDAWSAIPAAAQQTWQFAGVTLRFMGRMLIGEVSLRKNISGPIQIAQVAGESAQLGLIPFLGFLAVISISLGVLNLLPVPMLDGGQILQLMIEGVRGRPLSENALIASQYVGIALIGMLMLLAFYNDITQSI